MNKHLKYVNVQNIHKDLDRRTIVTITNTVRSSVLHTDYDLNIYVNFYIYIF
jgi:hypothetical protein